MASGNEKRSESFWLAFEKFALIFSFSMNVILLIVVLVLLGLLIPIKNQIAQPIMSQVMGELDRLGETHIKTTVVVEDEIQVKFGGGYIKGTVSIDIPADTTLPVLLNTTVPVDQMVPVKLSVPVDINLGDTDLQVVVDSFGELLEPIDIFLGK